MKFTEFEIPSYVLKALDEMGFTEMTPIQEQTYPIISKGKDLCGLAETGSGKTAACAIPLTQMIDRDNKKIQALVVVPTRELGIQYVDEIGQISRYAEISCFAVYGGFDKDIQSAKIKDGAQILVATPGRLIDLMYDGKVSLNDIKCVILDEADELLNEGFQEDIEFIFSCIRHDHQTLLFSATMEDNIKHLVEEILTDPEYITLIRKQTSPKSLNHTFISLHPGEKERTLVKYLQGNDYKQVIIFCNSRNQVDKLHGTLRKQFPGVEYIHAGLSQNKRSSIFRQFKEQRLKIMIATDVAGRGLDFSHVTHVVNWDFPRETEQYTHRSGRAGRMGRVGTALTFITRRDIGGLKKLFRTKNVNDIWIGTNPITGEKGSGSLTSGGTRPEGNASSSRSSEGSRNRSQGQNRNQGQNRGGKGAGENRSRGGQNSGRNNDNRSRQDNRPKQDNRRKNNTSPQKGQQSRYKGNNSSQKGTDPRKKEQGSSSRNNDNRNKSRSSYSKGNDTRNKDRNSSYRGNDNRGQGRNSSQRDNDSRKTGQKSYQKGPDSRKKGNSPRNKGQHRENDYKKNKISSGNGRQPAKAAKSPQKKQGFFARIFKKKKES